MAAAKGGAHKKDDDLDPEKGNNDGSDRVEDKMS